MIGAGFCVPTAIAMAENVGIAPRFLNGLAQEIRALPTSKPGYGDLVSMR
ncbi:MAG: hypothetical protein AAGD09_08845 [Cyanobacteria bacterium P01_F01_bin.56]